MEEYLTYLKKFNSRVSKLRKSKDIVPKITLDQLKENLKKYSNEPFHIPQFDLQNCENFQIELLKSKLKKNSTTYIRNYSENSFTFKTELKPISDVLDKFERNEPLFAVLDNLFTNKFKVNSIKTYGLFDEGNFLNHLPKQHFETTKTMLICAANRLTPFHFDGGTMSVQFLAKGKKTFILLPPNNNFYHNQKVKYKQKEQIWDCELEDDLLLELNEGDLFNIPPAYGHAVFTPQASISIAEEVINIENFNLCYLSASYENESRNPRSFFTVNFLIILILSFENISENLKIQNLKEYIKIVKTILPHIKNPALQINQKFQNLGLVLELTKPKFLHLIFSCLTRVDPGIINFEFNNFNVKMKLEHLSEILLIYKTTNNRSSYTCGLCEEHTHTRAKFSIKSEAINHLIDALTKLESRDNLRSF